MPGTGGTSISLFHSTTAGVSPTAGQLVAGELFINTNDGVIKYKDTGGVVQTIASRSAAAGGLGNWQPVKTASFNAAASSAYPIDTTAGAVTATLPASPSAGTFITFTDYAGMFPTNALTIARNGGKINGAASDVTLTGYRASATIVYIDSTQGWIAFAGFNQAPFGSSYTISYLAVGGGGGGSFGGGGAGGMLQSLATVNTGSSYAVTIGAGGTGSTTAPTNGGDTIASGIATATGGGKGSTYFAVAGAGGSGGGGAGGYVGGASVIGQGHDGGAGNVNGGGGGGGAGAQGQDAPANGAGYGGAGLSSSISGSTTYYAGGGAGVGNGSPLTAAGGIGGGGASGATTGTAGTANTGGGGGGAGTTPGSGGSGIFIIAYPGTPRGTGGTITQVGGNTIHTFTSNGTFVA